MEHGLCIGPHEGVPCSTGIKLEEPCRNPGTRSIRVVDRILHLCGRCAHHWWTYHRAFIRCDRCLVPSSSDRLTRVTCVYGCHHYQCELCGETTKAEARR